MKKYKIKLVTIPNVSIREYSGEISVFYVVEKEQLKFEYNLKPENANASEDGDSDDESFADSNDDLCLQYEDEVMYNLYHLKPKRYLDYSVQRVEYLASFLDVVDGKLMLFLGANNDQKSNRIDHMNVVSRYIFSLPSLYRGTRVLCNYKQRDEELLEGRISTVHDNQTYNVHYYNGKREKCVRAEHIRIVSQPINKHKQERSECTVFQNLGDADVQEEMYHIQNGMVIQNTSQAELLKEQLRKELMVEFNLKATIIQCCFRRYISKCVVQWLREEEIKEVRQDVVHQAFLVKSHIDPAVAAVQLQKMVRGHLGRKEAQRTRHLESEEIRQYLQSMQDEAEDAVSLLAEANEEVTVEQRRASLSIGGESSNGVFPAAYNLMPPEGYPAMDSVEEVQTEFCQTGCIRLFCATWNLNGHAPSDMLRALLQVEQHHIYAVGVQGADKATEGGGDGELSKWEQLLVQALGNKYELVATRALHGMHVALFAHKGLLPFVDSVETETVPTGSGDRGACAVSFKVAGSSVLVVNAHFAGGYANFANRNANFHEINARLSLPGGKYNPTAPVINRFNHVFWMGDLNYRLEGSRAQVEKLLVEGRFESLWASDQLCRAWSSRDAFEGYCEGPLNFPPTFKYELHSDDYDTSAAQQVPSWCDRVLWKVSPAVVLLGYDAFDHIRTSEHRPVWAAHALVVVDATQYGHQLVQTALRHQKPDFPPNQSFSLPRASSQRGSPSDSKSSVCSIM